MVSLDSRATCKAADGARLGCRTHACLIILIVVGRPRRRDRRLRRRVTSRRHARPSCRRPAVVDHDPRAPDRPTPTCRSRQARPVEEVAPDASTLDEPALAEVEPEVVEPEPVEPPVVVPRRRPSALGSAKARSAFAGAIGSVLVAQHDRPGDLGRPRGGADPGRRRRRPDPVELLDSVRATVKETGITTPDALIEAVKAEMQAPSGRRPVDPASGPTSRRPSGSSSASTAWARPRRSARSASGWPTTATRW